MNGNPRNKVYRGGKCDLKWCTGNDRRTDVGGEQVDTDSTMPRVTISTSNGANVGSCLNMKNIMFEGNTVKKVIPTEVVNHIKAAFIAKFPPIKTDPRPCELFDMGKVFPMVRTKCPPPSLPPRSSRAEPSTRK